MALTTPAHCSLISAIAHVWLLSQPSHPILTQGLPFPALGRVVEVSRCLTISGDYALRCSALLPGCASSPRERTLTSRKQLPASSPKQTHICRAFVHVPPHTTCDPGSLCGRGAFQNVPGGAEGIATRVLTKHPDLPKDTSAVAQAVQLIEVAKVYFLKASALMSLA